MSAKVPQQRTPERTTRRPTGLPSWPILLIAGAEKAGKSWACAEASASDLVGRALWIGVGEDDPDEYGAVEGADFEIVPHDGSYRDILAAVDWACSQPPVDGKPVLVVLDSATRLWDLLCDMAQDAATARQRKKKGVTEGDEEADIASDLWNLAKARWGHVLDALRAHKGPTLLTARLEEVTVFVNGQPARDGSKQWKVKAEKNLPYDVGGIVELPARGEAWLTGVRSVRHKLPARLRLNDFTVDDLWRKLGLADLAVGERTHSGITRTDPIVAQRVVLLNAIKDAVGNDEVHIRRIAAEWQNTHDGKPITETTDIDGLELLRDDLVAANAQADEKAGATA